MPSCLSALILLVPAAVLAYGDFRRREVGVVWLAALGVAAAACGITAWGWRAALFHAGVNTGVLFFSGAILLVWRKIRRQPFREFFRTGFGAGDTVMMLALVPLFGPSAYVRFLIVCCAVSLGWWTLQRSPAIPFAGFMALTLMVHTLFQTVGIWN